MSKAEAGVYGALKEDAFMETLEAIEQYPELVQWRTRLEKQKKAAKERVIESIDAVMKGSNSKL